MLRLCNGMNPPWPTEQQTRICEGCAFLLFVLCGGSPNTLRRAGKQQQDLKGVVFHIFFCLFLRLQIQGLQADCFVIFDYRLMIKNDKLLQFLSLL